MISATSPYISLVGGQQDPAETEGMERVYPLASI